MLRTFNCGIGMIVVVAAEAADAVAEGLFAVGEAPLFLGRLVVPGPTRVAFRGRLKL